jgi:hypothetical protein
VLARLPALRPNVRLLAATIPTSLFTDADAGSTEQRRQVRELHRRAGGWRDADTTGN